MLTRLRRHVQRQAVGFVALFIALGGVSYAVVALPRNSVGSTQIKSGAVRNADLANNAVTSAKVRSGSLRGSDFRAVVEADGSVTRSVAVEGVAPQTAGIYIVDFTQDARDCAVLATMRPTTIDVGAIAVSTNALGNVVVRTFNNANVATNFAFNIALIC